MAHNIDGLIREGVAALKAGRKDDALRLLTRATELDERNEDAWLWLSAVVDNLENQQICLENVLAINPNNARALQGLNQIQKKLESRAHLDADDSFAQPPPSPPSAPPQAASSPFDLSAPIQGGTGSAPQPQNAAGGYHGSGQQVDLPSSSEYDDWVDTLNLGTNNEQPADDFGMEYDAGGDAFGYEDYEAPAARQHFDPFAMPASNEMGFDDTGYDALSELEELDSDETLFDDVAFEGASPFGMFEDIGEEYEDEQGLAGYLEYLPPDIKPTHLPGEQAAYPASLLVGLGAVSLGIIAALAILVMLVV